MRARGRAARRAPGGGRSRGGTPSGTDAGGAWIATGIVLGVLAYGAVVLMLAAGYSSVLPVVVVPPVLVGLVGAGNLLGGRTSGGGGPPAPRGGPPAPGERP